MTARLKTEAAPGSLSWSIGNIGRADFGNGLGVCRGTWDPLVPCPFCHNLLRLSPKNLSV